MKLTTGFSSRTFSQTLEMVSTNTGLKLENKNHNESVTQNVKFVSIISNTNLQITIYKVGQKKKKKSFTFHICQKEIAVLLV